MVAMIFMDMIYDYFRYKYMIRPIMEELRQETQTKKKLIDQEVLKNGDNPIKSRNSIFDEIME